MTKPTSAMPKSGKRIRNKVRRELFFSADSLIGDSFDVYKPMKIGGGRSFGKEIRVRPAAAKSAVEKPAGGV